MQASNVTKPSRSGLAPKPTQQFCEASVTITPCSTASRALPPAPNIFHAALLASSPASQVEMTIAFPFIELVSSLASAILAVNIAAELNTDDAMNFLRFIIVYL